MSRRDSSGRGGPAMAKLKEGLQEAIVFLQTLGSFKIPAVIENRRKELLKRLTLLQGVQKDNLPVVEPHSDEITSSKEEKLPIKAPDKDKAPEKEVPESESISSASSTVTSPSHDGKVLKKRDSMVVSSLVKDYESIQYSAKKEEESETPKRLFTLKKVAKPTDFPDIDKDDKDGSSAKEPEKEKSPDKEEKATEKEVESKTKQDKLEVVNRERASSVVSGDESIDAEDEDEEGDGKGVEKKKKKTKKGFGLKMKGFMKKEKSPAPERKHPDNGATVIADGNGEVEEQAKQEEVEELAEELEEGVRISGILERMKKKIGHKKHKSVKVKVLETTLMIGDSEVELVNCVVEVTDVGFDLTHPQHKSPFMFKVEGEDETRQKWVTIVREAIQKATPVEEEAEVEEATKSLKSEAIPSITVEEIASTLSTSKKAKRESKALTIKPEKKLPDQGVIVKGYIHRKKPGLARNWEKTYCVLTYQAMYFTTQVDNKDYSNMLSIYPNMDAKLESKKGKNADSPGLGLKLGKKAEHFSFQSQNEFKTWKAGMESVLGLGGVEELLSEDEELDASGMEPEELYEELEIEESVPPVPASPRPSHHTVNPPPIPLQQEDDFAIDEDIYEDTDDILPDFSQSSNPAPSLPNRNPPKATNAFPAPSLPPRNAPAPASPNLPPRGTPGKTKDPLPQEYEMTGPGKPAAKTPAPVPPSTAAAGDEDGELYDDVVVAGEDAEEMYDDVVIGGMENGDGEELYDDVLTAGEPITEEFYEDMAPGAAMDPYVALEKNKEGEVPSDEELYVDVNEPPSTPVKKVQDSATAQMSSSPRSSTMSKLFNKKSSTAGSSRVILNGNVSYKAPKKSKFDDRWGVVEGSHLLIYKTSSDKRSQDKISLGDCRLDIGSTEAGAGKFAFSLSKGDKFYHISLQNKVEVDRWVGVLKGIVKYAPVEMGAVDELESEIYQARQDHIADSSNELTFKTGTYIKLLERESKDMWYGQIGDESQVFEGKKGRFPANKVELAEDLYD